MKRWLGLFAVFIVIAVVAIVVGRRPRPTVAGFELVQTGMPLSEVERIIGLPGDYSGAGLLTGVGRERDWIFLENGKRWRLAISLDEEGRVVEKKLIPVLIRFLT